MKLIITGSTGAIGSNLTPWLKKNHDVIVTKSDIRDKTSLDTEIAENTNADWIINLAGIVNTDLCNLAKRHAYDVNVVGAENIANLAKKYGIKLCHFSTTAFYKPTDIIREDSAVEPQTWYGTTKYLGELAVRKVLNDDVLVIRPCFAFGGDNDRSIASRLIYSAYYHEPIVVQLNPIYKKDYMHVLNLCDAIERVLKTGYIGNVNISVGNPIAFGEVVETAKRVVDKDPFIYSIPEDDYMKDHIVDHTKFMSLVDWEPTISLEEGMRIVFEKIKSKELNTRQ